MDPISFDQAQMALTQAGKPNMAKTANIAKAREAAQQFEAVFVTQMLSHMFTAIEAEDGIFGGGHAESMFRPMMLDEYGKMVAGHGRGIGVADHVTRSLLQTQEVQ